MHERRFYLIIILGLLSAIGAFSIDTYIAGFPAIAADFHVPIDTVSYSISSFFLGICIGQMICGPLLDRFGRRIPLLIGLFLYTIASVGCAISNSIEMLIVVRFFQALGGCVGIVAPRAIVRDIFPLTEIAKIFSLLVLVLGVSPIIAPTIGSYLIIAFGWHSVFWLQVIIGLSLLITVYFFLPESRPGDASMSLHPKVVSANFFRIFTNAQFITYALCGAVVSSGVYAYLAGSSAVFMKIYGVNEQEYGYIFGMTAAGLIGSSQLNTLALRKQSSISIIQRVLPIQAIFGIILVGLSLLNLHTFYTMLSIVLVFVSCQGFIHPNTSALSLTPFSKDAGSASALMGAIQMSFGALATALVGWFGDGTTLPLTTIMACCPLVGLLIFGMGRLVGREE
ncbi:multidrug effflux MFS transporter [Emticicia sp. C21]|uniref:multidrug effflux MFS transporter n=1 Tax=Emticicia sp. C21 TaxID=2302915 RepID=UPI000E3498A5|nr:multidrug effflux MFS transporter [Emticicia sp. C21]RFS17044.1 Bcr/CflA family efflux MFS transporter [Emticicia sp. C21]